MNKSILALTVFLATSSASAMATSFEFDVPEVMQTCGVTQVGNNHGTLNYGGQIGLNTEVTFKIATNSPQQVGSISVAAADSNAPIDLINGASEDVKFTTDKSGDISVNTPIKMFAHINAPVTNLAAATQTIAMGVITVSCL